MGCPMVWAECRRSALGLSLALMVAFLLVFLFSVGPLAPFLAQWQPVGSSPNAGFHFFVVLRHYALPEVSMWISLAFPLWEMALL